MAEYLIQGETLDDIADAINAKTGGSSAMTPSQMAAAIGNIPSGGGGGEISTQSINISANGTYRAPTGKAYTPVNVNVPNTYAASDEGKVVDNGALVSQTAHAEVTQNGTIDTTLNNSVIVNVPTGSDITLDTLNATANGTYTPTSGHAYSSVVVAIPAVTGVSF